MLVTVALQKSVVAMVIAVVHLFAKQDQMVAGSFTGQSAGDQGDVMLKLVTLSLQEFPSTGNGLTVQ